MPNFAGAEETALELFQGTDRQFIFRVYTTEAKTVARDITGWALSWMVKRYRSDADAAALIAKTTVSGIVISGVFNSVPATNTQIATVTVADTDSTTLATGLFHHELKRTDDAFETTAAFGPFQLRQGVHR